MNDKFDELAKGLAQSVTRRVAPKRFGLGLAVIALAGQFSAFAALITFEDFTAGAPGSVEGPADVSSRYAASGITFANASGFDYSKSAAYPPGFAHSGTKAIEACYLA